MAYWETGKWENAIDVANRVLASNSSEKKSFKDEKAVYDQKSSVSINPIDPSLFLMIFSVHEFLLMAIDYFYGLWLVHFEVFCTLTAKCSIMFISRDTAFRYGPKANPCITLPVPRFGGVITRIWRSECPDPCVLCSLPLLTVLRLLN
jgi:hypothetical protein